MKDLGYGREYRYAHDEPGAYAAGETYLPDGMPAPGLYEPTDRGLEAKIADKLGASAPARSRRQKIDHKLLFLKTFQNP